MKKYFGLIEVEAEPCSKSDYYTLTRNITPVKNEDGYLVELQDNRKDCFWDEKEQFEFSYPRENISFSLALEYMKAGYKVSRKNWKDDYIHIVNNIIYLNSEVVTLGYNIILANDWYVIEE